MSTQFTEDQERTTFTCGDVTIEVDATLPLPQYVCKQGHPLRMVVDTTWTKFFIACDPCGIAKPISKETSEEIERLWTAG